MLKNINLNKYYSILVSWYVLLFGLYSIMTRFTLLNLGIQGLPNTVLYVGLIAVGGALAIYGFFRERDKIITKKNGLVFLFIGIMLVSSIMNSRYDLWGNMKAIFIYFIQFVLFYSIMLFMTKEEFKRCLNHLFLILNALWVIASLGSIVLFLLNLAYPLYYIEERIIRQGFVQGRLFGFFSDPNFASFTSLLIIFGLLHIIANNNKKSARRMLVPCIAIHVLYIVMSNSRTVFIAAAVSMIVLVLLYQKRKDVKLTIKKILISTIMTVVLMTGTYFILLGGMHLCGYLLNSERTVNELLRDDVRLENISNNRTTIWKNYLALYKNKPLLGTSPRGALLYADEISPNGYLSQKKYVTHNGYLSLLVTTGIVGFSVMFLFFIMNLKRAGRLIQKKDALCDENILMITVLTAILIFTFFFTNFFFTNNLETMLLWISLGVIANNPYE